METDRQITLYTWGQILRKFKSRQRALGAMAALYKGARISADSPKVKTYKTNKKYKYVRIAACFKVEMALSPLCMASI